MKMVPYNAEKLRHYKLTKNYRLIDGFLNGDDNCVQLVDHGYKSAHVAQSVLTMSIVRFRFAGVKVVTRGEDVFLVKVKP